MILGQDGDSNQPVIPDGEGPVPGGRRRRAGAPVARAGAHYCRLTLAFVIGLYLPWTSGAPDLLRHFGEAVHSWVVVFFWPVALWRLLRNALPAADDRPDEPG